jgi:hypothetical protein
VTVFIDSIYNRLIRGCLKSMKLSSSLITIGKKPEQCLKAYFKFGSRLDVVVFACELVAFFSLKTYFKFGSTDFKKDIQIKLNQCD